MYSLFSSASQYASGTVTASLSNYIIIFMFMPFRKIFFYETVILTQSAIKHSFSEICIKEAGKKQFIFWRSEFTGQTGNFNTMNVLQNV
ncbi:hypothetical protein B4168_2673 [Anoxybacillus flavithermus]|nr:hypothetical protein GT20_1374 [Parageobacillus thermoglucosidasius TNO-09.020]KYD15997.1 hypothetical protein B4168_2673 [Anoxybacillus flavithermus]OAO87439.1 hypothetical protein GT23_1088 [Parageobacillus thermoglucosidasius]